MEKSSSKHTREARPVEAQSPLLEGSCQERSLDWRQERWETGWLGSQHYCGTAGVRPTEQHTIKHWSPAKYKLSGVMELGETILFSFSVGRQDYVNEVPKVWGGGELWDSPRAGTGTAWEHFLPVLTYAWFKIY